MPRDHASAKERESRTALLQARRVVVKLGTRLLANRRGKPDADRMRALVHDISQLYRGGKEIVVVTSGAIGMGKDALGMRARPTSLADLQMAAAVGQSRLMAYYGKLFAAQKLKVGQVLLTHEDLNNRTRHLNARNTMLHMLQHRVVPIVNENDVVSVDQIKLGDNDTLAALVALLIDADVLVLLTSVNGLQEAGPAGRKRRISFIPTVTSKHLALARGKGSILSVGGMATKLQAAQNAVAGGLLAVIADGRREGILHEVFSGKDVGTFIGGMTDSPEVKRNRQRWICFFHRAQGSVLVDEGAHKALELRGTSLLPIGVKQVRGIFQAGALVNVCSLEGRLIARGLTEYSSEDIEQIKGRKTTEIAPLLGVKHKDEIIHRDNMVVLNVDGEDVI